MSENGNGHHNGDLNGFANSRWGRLSDDPPGAELEPMVEDEELTPQERATKRRRETALRLIAEGRFATPEQQRKGREAGNATRRRRAQPLNARLAELAEEKSDILFGIVFGIAQNGKADKDRLQAVTLLTNVTDWSQRILREDEGNFAKLQGKALQDALVGAMSELTGIDPAAIESMAGIGTTKKLDGGDVIEGEAYDVDD